MNYENKGIIFENKYKETDRHPDFKGRINFKGVEYDLGAWYGTTRNGDKMLSLKVGEVYEPNRQAPQPTQAPQEPQAPRSSMFTTNILAESDDLDNELPF